MFSVASLANGGDETAIQKRDFHIDYQIDVGRQVDYGLIPHDGGVPTVCRITFGKNPMGTGEASTGAETAR